MAPRGVILALSITSFLVACASDHSVGPVDFGYSGATGRANWSSICSKYELCSTGKQQSPINIVKENAVRNSTLGPLHRHYVPTNATLFVNGFNIALEYNKKVGHVEVDGKNYSLIQLHWHTPSEHTINGKRYPMELHLVHKSADGGITIVAMLYRFGGPDPFIFQMKKKLAQLAKEERAGDAPRHVPVSIVQTRAMKRNVPKYYRYVGSLTTPPCTENVIWNVIAKVKHMSSEQAKEMQAPLDEAYRHNSRPTQPLNGRTVQLYARSKEQ